jgi:hypothetical protein
VTITKAIQTSPKPTNRLDDIFSWYASQPSKKLIVGTEYCIGPKTVSGNLRDAAAKSNNGTAVTTPDSKIKMMCQKFADFTTELSYLENQIMSAIAGTTRKIVSDIKL